MVTNITPLPPAPVRGSTEATFSETANAFVAALPTMVTQINAAGDEIEAAVTAAQLAETNAETAEANAELAEAAAVAAANYKGPWSSLVGALAIPASVSHSGVVWQLVDSLADVTASEPTLVNSDWIALTTPIATGTSALITEFELEGDSAAIGDLVGLYSNGKVKVIKNHPGETAQNAATSTFVNAIALSTTKGISIYRDESDGNKVKAQLYSIAGRKITNIGTPVTIANTSATYVHADKIDASNVIAVYQDTSDSSQGKAIIINISGNTISTGSAAVFNAAVTTYCKICVLTSVLAVAVYRDEGNSNYGVACKIAIAGTVATPATEVNFKTSAVLYLDVTRLTDTKCVVSFAGTSTYPEACTLIVNPGIVAGTPFVLKSATTASTTISRLTDTTCVASYESGSLLYTRHLTDAAGTLSAGTEVTIQANPSYLESCQLTATRVVVSGRNATVSNYGYYWLIDNTSGTTLSNSASAAFNSGTTSHTFVSKIQDNRVLAGYQDSTNYATAYVIDLSTETLKTIAGIVKEAGVEGDLIDVVTEGECDFLSGLTPGSYYYSSATGALSASTGDYEVGVAKSATNFKINRDIKKVSAELMAYIDEIYATKSTPSLIKALSFNIWKTREIKTSSGTFTVPSGVYYLGIACVGKGGDQIGTGGYGVSGAGGGGLSFSLRKVTPGEQITYTISGGIARCGEMVANYGSNNSYGSTPDTTYSGGAGGTASGGDYNYTGGNGGNAQIIGNAYDSRAGGGGAGGGAGGESVSQSSANYKMAGGGGGRGFPDDNSKTPGAGGTANGSTSGASWAGGGGPIYSGGSPSMPSTSTYYGTGAGLGQNGFDAGGGSVDRGYTLSKGINPFSLTKLGLCKTSEALPPEFAHDAQAEIYQYSNNNGASYPFGVSTSPTLSNIIPNFGSACAGNQNSGYSGFATGSGGISDAGSSGSGVLGGCGGSHSTHYGLPGYGGGAGGSNTVTSGGGAVVIFIY